jgi:hypothetical protein
LSTLHAAEAIPFFAGLIPHKDITGAELLAEMQESSRASPMLSYLKLTASWSETIDHARILLLPTAPTVPLGAACTVTLLVEACGASIESLDYITGVMTVDGVDHKVLPMAAVGCFTVRPGDAGCHDLDLSTFITAPGRHVVGFRHGGLITHPIEVVVTAP